MGWLNPRPFGSERHGEHSFVSESAKGCPRETVCRFLASADLAGMWHHVALHRGTGFGPQLDDLIG
jgi:hypothetical protein